MSKDLKEYSNKSYILTLLLVIFLGNMGVHRFYLGSTGYGLIMFTAFWVVGLIGLVTGTAFTIIGLCLWWGLECFIVAVGLAEDWEGKIVSNKAT